MENEENIEEIESIEDVIEQVSPGISREEYEKIRQEAISKAKNATHNWHLKGRGILACTSCPIPHRSYIATDLTMTGIDERGNPILKKIS